MCSSIHGARSFAASSICGSSASMKRLVWIPAAFIASTHAATRSRAPTISSPPSVVISCRFSGTRQTESGFNSSASFVIAVNAQVSAEQLRQRFPAQSKLGPVDRIRDLVNLQLPGIGLRALPVAPRQLPFHAGFHYFELDRGGELWKQLERSGSLALHVAGDFPGLELELWAIRQ